MVVGVVLRNNVVRTNYVKLKQIGPKRISSVDKR